MANTTQDKLFETFIAISGGKPSSLDPFIDASVELAGTVGDIAKVMSSTVMKGTVTAGPELVGRPAQGPVPDPAGSATPGPVPDPAPSTRLADLIATVVPGDAPAAPLMSIAVPSDALSAAKSPAAASAPSGASAAGSTAESVASTLLQNVFGSVPLVGAIGGTHSGGIGGTIESIASTVLKSGLGLIPMIGGLLGLFGGGDSPAPPPLVKYAMPASIGFEGADTGSGISLVDYDQMGMPRAYGGASSGGSSSGSAPAPQITVNVQAMDARSFLDRSSDIAAAVRDAMLNLNSINDVVNEL